MFLFIGGCAELDKIMGVTQVVAPPIVDAVQPGLGVLVGSIIGGVSVVGGGITTLAIALRKKKKP